MSHLKDTEIVSNVESQVFTPKIYNMPGPGIEPRSPARQASVLTTTLRDSLYGLKHVLYNPDICTLQVLSFMHDLVNNKLPGSFDEFIPMTDKSYYRHVILSLIRELSLGRPMGKLIISVNHLNP